MVILLNVQFMVKDESYNDIQMWEYTKLAKVFGTEEKSLTCKVENEYRVTRSLN